ncbi:hypothetical protein L7F22_046963 [Adiantum nelumboides]|nr:hypothetical protein [Adiantum nelumboides]
MMEGIVCSSTSPARDVSSVALLLAPRDASAPLERRPWACQLFAGCKGGVLQSPHACAAFHSCEQASILGVIVKAGVKSADGDVACAVPASSSSYAADHGQVIQCKLGKAMTTFHYVWQIVYAGSSSGHFLAWDLRGGRSSTAFITPGTVYNPPFVTLKMQTLLEQIPALTAQTAIEMSGVQSISLNPCCEQQLAFHLVNGW